MRPFENIAELRELLDALCEETITAEQLRRLEDLILSHPEAEAYYVQTMGLHAELARHFVGGPTAKEPAVPPGPAGEATGIERGQATPGPRPAVPAPRIGRWRRALWGGLGLAGLAAGLVLAVVLWQLRSSGKPLPAPPGPERVDNSVAVLLEAPGAEWGETTELPTRVGAPLPPGQLSLKAGLAHIEFYSGATVIIQGPAELQLISPREAYCALGKLRVTVPPQAQGFTIGSPKLDFVDRGTEFGLDVRGGDRTEVHVFQGKVDVYDPSSGRQGAAREELTTGRGLRLEGPGVVNPIKSDSAAFLTAQDVAARAEAETRRRQAEWLAASTALRRDPTLVVYYPFEPGPTWARTLPDQAAGRREPHDGAIVGCSWATGRWPGKVGLEFKQVSDRVRFNVPGEFEALTLAAWVRVDALPNRFNSLMMTDGWEEAAPHWHISADGRIELGVQGRNRKGGVHYLTPHVITPDRLGQWVHLAVVYDREAQQVTHYVDGRPVMPQPLELDIALRLGDVELGNWNVGSRHHTNPIRYFSGCMDEFLLFSRALDGQEIERLHGEGRPPS
jgi:hypothetical protein